MAFVQEGNECGQALLKIVARGSAILAELQRLSANIPDIFRADYQGNKYEPLLFDFAYFNAPEYYDKRVSSDLSLSDLDEELHESYEVILERFYKLFDSVYRYAADFVQFLKDLKEGVYIQHTMKAVLTDVDGAQLLCEAVYLLGVMLLFMDQKIPGYTRERLIITHFRFKGEGSVPNIEEVKKLFRDTGYSPGKRPSDYPEAYFQRAPMDMTLIDSLIERLRSEDVYNRKLVFPAPAHRSIARSLESSMVYVILYFAPHCLHRDANLMRDLVSRNFGDNWVISTYMGAVVDLGEEWMPYKAARDALIGEVVRPDKAKELADHHRSVLLNIRKDMKELMTEGILTEEFLVEKKERILDVLREVNNSLKWILLHRRTTVKKVREVVLGSTPNDNQLLAFLLTASELEYKLKRMFTVLVESKEGRWSVLKESIIQRLDDLAEYFTGKRALSRDVERNEALEYWFKRLATVCNGLEYQKVASAGHKIQRLMKVLEDVKQFDAIDANGNVKTVLDDIRGMLQVMIRIVNIEENVLSNVENISDFSYAWEIMNDFTKTIHDKVQEDAGTVVRLRALFEKLTSVLELPLSRIIQAESPDADSVAEHYSTELVAYVRRVTEIIPVIVFQLLSQIILLQTHNMKSLPVKLPLADLKNMAQLQQRHQLAQLTHRISIFTEGILAMEKTLLGVIQVDPRQILNDGIRKYLVRQICSTLHQLIQFDKKSKNPKLDLEQALERVTVQLSGYKRSFEYIQDYINIYGLKMWQEEYTRIIHFNVEQECNRFIKRKILPQDSEYQDRDAPIPLFSSGNSKSVGFLGRLMNAFLSLTDPRVAIYSLDLSGWFEISGREIAGLELMTKLNKSIGIQGLTGIDRILSFRASQTLTDTVRGYTMAYQHLSLPKFSAYFQPKNGIVSDVKVYSSITKQLSKHLDSMLPGVLRVGQVQLFRRAIAQELQFSCRLDSNLLYSSLRTFNNAVVTDIRRHYHSSEQFAYPAEQNPLLPELSKYVEATGITDPLTKIYITSKPLPYMGFWLALLTIHNMPRLAYDKDFSTLVRRKPSEQVDGTPLAVGIATLLKQLHPSVTNQYLAYCGQYIRSLIFASFSTGKSAALPVEAVNMLLFLRMYQRVAKLSKGVLERVIPSYIYDSISIA